jgi:hypothetical protein
LIKIGRSRPETGAWMQRMRDQASMASERMGPSAQRARDMAGERMHGARMWTAPQLDRMAGFVEHDLGPRLSAMLTSTARRIEPPRRSHRLRNTMLVILGCCGAIGIAGALVTRYRLMNESYEEMTEETMSAVDSSADRSTTEKITDASHHSSGRPNS